nr:phosphatase PAP2 family protein [uncultured Shinella sp.]
MLFLPAERLILVLTVLLLALSAPLIAVKGVAVDIGAYAVLILGGIAMLGLGQYYRRVRSDERIAASVTATGVFILFTLAGSVFNYMLLPVFFTPIDPLLLRLDAAVGFDWPAFVTWVSNFPFFGSVLQVVYFSSLPQMAVIILALGFFADGVQLQRFMLTGVLGALLAILFWSFFPSFGTSAVYDLPAEVLARMPMAADPAYGRELVRLSREGVTALSPHNVLGLIAFPSFHTIMACMSVVFLARVRFLAIPAVIINLLMVPAILVQGGHHLMDVFGGIAVFCLSYVLSGQILRRHAAPALERRAAAA